ncbi:uncharacterized protein K452DRAFT_329001 [Aplosporella prunicola CBS 121167]|uniref:N-acetyltransferase domain-containing protein n=1 Tax=Aplosporella prunicola CBS 121167 TaxID=1176127 RepID=A0A6A6B2P2_9PEZI|nr:uncharacterized protein K452DRAFT_329001 [Aplosporella prunicola CBS 121167]KAF2138086.1 hypothetical protein K452DRAFT_329001 [Aplosporella prunicola CBS 121167]
MSTEFISFLGPTASLAAYDPTKPAAKQESKDIPTAFKDAMTVRQRVFVEEQGVALENEFDGDDPRCYHWVVYASVGTTNGHSNGANSSSSDPLDDPAAPARRNSTANRVAVGTIRLVPPPHPAHPAPSDHHKFDNSLHAPPTICSGNGHDQLRRNSDGSADGSTAKPVEPYIKLGRMAILPAYRKLGLAALLVRTALEWARQNANEVLSPPPPEAVELARVEGRESELEAWRGLCLVHAQAAIERWWTKFGFVTDQSMGVWDEEGIDHVGMWLRVKVKE